MQPQRLILLSTLLVLLQALTPTEDIQLFPNTENSPSLYLIKFKLDKALPSLSYLLVAMDWYSSALLPYNCALVNTSISVRCTNFQNPTFALTASTSNFQKFNAILSTNKVVAVELGSNLLANTEYALQLHLYNVVPNIQKISPSVQMYTISADGLIYQQNPNMGAVINSQPNTQLLSVSILNDLSANSPGSSSTLRAEVTIGQAVSTYLSTFMFKVHYPFSFSVGSIPTTTESTSYATNPIALYSSPSIYSYEVLTPNIFMLVFNQQFAVGRKFIVQINQISNPFQIASTNISIYSLNYNTLTPLQAYEMLYPIATASYPLTLTLGLPYDAPFQDAMQYYQSTQNYIQLSILIPYTIPEGYVMRIQFTNNNAYFYAGTAYINIASLTYTPTYDYSISQYILLISNMGPIVVGTTLKVTALIYVNTNTQFAVSVYIDTPTIITTSPSKYLYQGLVEGSGISYSNFFNNFYDNRFSWSWRVQSSTSFISGQWIYFYVYQNIDSTATSSGSYLRFYLPPIVQVSPSFDPNNDCRISNNVNSCQITFVKTSTYLQVTIKGSASYLVSNPNIFPYQTSIYIYLRNILFPKSSSNKIIYPVYATLYKSDIVNPTQYKRSYFISADPYESGMTGVTFDYLSNYITSTPANYQTYPGALRFASTVPASMNLVVQPQQRVVIAFYARYGFRSLATQHMGSYPCTSNIGVTCQYFQGQTGWAQLLVFDQIVATFTDASYTTTNFHLLIPDMQTAQQNNYFWYHVGIYNTLTKDYTYTYSARFYRVWNDWPTSVSTYSTFQADIVGKAGSYKDDVAVTVYNPSISTGGTSFIFLCTQWSLFENGVTTFSPSTLAMATPATFTGTNEKTPLAVYLANGMYLTIIPFTYVSSQATFTFYLNNAHLPYTYDLPTYYIYAVRNSDWFLTSSNALIMANGGTLYESPLQSLVISCQDNALGVANTYCTVVFGTSNPLLATGKIRLSLSGLTVATSTCFLYFINGTAISVTCESSSDNKNVTVTMNGWQFYPIGTYTLVVYGIGISNDSLSQSMTLYLYESSLSFVIETGVRILMTTIAGLSYISLTEIMYSYLNPLSYTTMTINYYLPRPLYKDEEFAFVIGQDLSDVNTEVSRLAIHITRQDGVVLKPLYYIDNVNYLIVFQFDDPTQLMAGTYTMTIAGACTPVSQKNAFNMIYRRKQDFAYTLVNNYQNVIFPDFEALVTSDIALQSYFNTEGYKQDIVFTLINQNDKVNSLMRWVINFPSYYSSQLFQQLPYCMINGSPIPCSVDPTTPYQLLIYNSPATVEAGTPYEITVVGLAAPRRTYTNNAYPQRYIFVGVLLSSTSTAYAERAMLAAEQNIQQAVTGVIKVLNMIGVAAASLYSFSSLYAQFQMQCNVAITTGSYLYLDLPTEFDNLNNVPINSILLFSTNTLSANTQVVNRRIEIPISTTIPANTIFQVQFPNLPTPLTPCSTEMSRMIVTVAPSNKLTLTAASQVQGNSAPRLTFQVNSLYISFNYNQPVVITAGTYSQSIPITPSDNSTFLSNTNIQLQSTGFVFEPSSVFLSIGQSRGSFRIGADNSLVPITYFYQAIKQEEVNTRYQITLNMNIEVTTIPVPITIPSTITVPQGGCSSPFLIQLTNPPFMDLTITYVFDNTLYSETDLYPNPITTLPEMNFGPNNTNATLSFCTSSALPLGSIPLALYLSGTNYNSYTFTPSNQITLNVVNSVANTTPVLTLALNNQQKTFLDVNFTNNVDGIIFYEMTIGSGVTMNSLQNMQVYTKSGQWILASRTDFFTRLYTADRDNRITQFFQVASTTTKRINNLFPESPYTLCAYLINAFGVVSSPACLNQYTMAWGTAIKAKLSFSSVLNPQQLNNVLCFFTISAGTNQLYLVDGEGNSCGNRTASNTYYKYKGSSFTTELQGTNIYLFTNPSLTGSDPAPLAFTNLFAVSGFLSAATLTSAQSTFSITYLSGSYANSFNARMMTDSSQASGLSVFYSTPTYNSGMKQIIINNVQIIGGTGTIYFLLVFYKEIVVNSTSGHTTVNIRMNQQPTNEQILNCQNWLGQAAQGCARAVYTGVAPLKVIFTNVEPNSMYQLYYLVASEFPMRPIVGSAINADTVVTYAWAQWFSLPLLGLLLMIL